MLESNGIIMYEFHQDAASQGAKEALPSTEKQILEGAREFETAQILKAAQLCGSSLRRSRRSVLR